jgi:hypothetical protein
VAIGGRRRIAGVNVFVSAASSTVRKAACGEPVIAHASAYIAAAFSSPTMSRAFHVAPTEAPRAFMTR